IKKIVYFSAGLILLSTTLLAAETEQPWWPSKYGAEDQIGTLNEITPEKSVEAAKLVKVGKIYDLGRVVDENIPRCPGRYWHQTLVSNSHILNQRRLDFGGSGWGKNQINWITEIVTGTYQLGTQIDGLNHLQIGDRFYNGFQAKDIVEEWGTNKLGVEGIPPIITRGVLIDLTEERLSKRMDAGEVVTVKMIEDFLKKHSLEIRKGDALLFHTGWGSLWDQPEAFSKGEPGPGLEVAKWLIDQSLAVTGCDTWSFGAVPGEDPERPFQIPQMLNVKHGLFILENLKTEALAQDRIYEFQFVITHAKTKGSTASQISPAAVI
ncbi:MAG: cyclase family protein, partial [Chlamydiales bacterium]|nr:cyclase family protein [Chlamydiales bacterium]